MIETSLLEITARLFYCVIGITVFSMTPNSGNLLSYLEAEKIIVLHVGFELCERIRNTGSIHEFFELLRFYKMDDVKRKDAYCT